MNFRSFLPVLQILNRLGTPFVDINHVDSPQDALTGAKRQELCATLLCCGCPKKTGERFVL
jgi:hypothetical protein